MVDVDLLPLVFLVMMMMMMMQVIGPSFSESFDGFLPSVLRYARGSRPASERAMAVGCFAEVFESIGP